MANGSNGETSLPVGTPQVVDELEMGLVPQAQAQLVAGLFGDQRIFVSAPQYHWHVQGTVGANDKAKHHIVALAEWLYQFGHRTKEREMEIWHRLSNTVDLPEVRRQLDQQHEIWASDYNKFTAVQMVFVKKEIGDFRHSIITMGD